MKITKIQITIREGGVKNFTLPLVTETTKGFVCATGVNESPATEWFAKDSKYVTSYTVKD